MNGSADLERRYRRLLAFYPRKFRAENSGEILAVLLDCAQDGQTKPGPGATADLLKGALWMRLRPPSTPPRTLVLAIRLMLGCAVVEIVGLLYVTAGTFIIRDEFRHAFPAATAADWHALASQLIADRIGGPIVLLLWLWMALYNSRGNDLARFSCFAFTALMTLLAVVSAANGLVRIAPVGAVIELAQCAASLTALVLIFTPQASRYYQRHEPNPLSTTH
ncbi:MAG TPA: hypothetical protein VH089_25700 [Streptosporangiaceae bacterium]|nr:hypothetical protein [Streptosporangiaceae bacterium]